MLFVWCKMRAVSEPDQLPDEFEIVNGDLERWLAEFNKPPRKRSKWHRDFSFPSDRLRDEYIATILDRPEEQVRMLISEFLVPQGSLGSDSMRTRSFDEIAEQRGYLTEFEKRLQKYERGNRRSTP